MLQLLDQLVRDERGQDLIEYALLAAGLGFVGLAAWPAIQTAIGATYQVLDTNSQNLWEPPAPGGS